MTLIISILVLLFSIFSMSPYMLAYRIPIPKNDNHQWTDISDLRLTVNQGSTTKPVKEATYQKKAKILYLNNLLSERQLYGQWREAHMGQNDNSGGQQGYANMRYAADYQSYQESFDIVLCSYNGLYSNTNYTCLTFSEFVPFITDSMFNEQEMTLSFNDVTVHKSEGVVNSINNLGSDCVVNSSIYFPDPESDEPFKPTFNFKVDREKLAVRFRVRSEQCGIDIVTSKMTVEDALQVDQAMPYAITMTTFAVVQCILCFGVTKALEKKKLISQKISQGTVRIISSFDLYLAMESLLQLTTNLTLGLIAIPYAILAIYFETKLMRTIITTQGNLMERGFKRLHIINAFCLIISVFVATLSAFFQHPEWMFWLFAFHMIPQIFQNFTTQRKYRFKYSLILLFVIPKIVYILYVLAFPRNLFRFSPNYQLLSILSGIFGVQLLLLAVQNKYPVFFAKQGDQYQFFEVPENGKEVCSICLEELDSPSPTKTGLDDSLMSDSTTETDPVKTPKEPVKQQTEKMTMVVTPCKHQFHECCLRDWARLKSVCPYCRSDLPPLPEQDDE